MEQISLAQSGKRASF